MSISLLQRTAHGAIKIGCHLSAARLSVGSLPHLSQYRCHSTSSVSQNEVSHFTKLASSWWDPHGPSRLLHLMNPLRHDFIASCLLTDHARDPTKKLKYLDIGCGGGIFASSAARLPHTDTVTAIDPTPSVIQVAKANQRSDPAIASPRLTYLNCAIEDLSGHIESQSSTTKDSQTQDHLSIPQYDIITVFEVLEHISSPSAFLARALTHLKPNGFLIGSTIARHPLSYITTKLIAEAPIVGVVPAGTHDWNQYINPQELQGWFTKQNSIEEGQDGKVASFNEFMVQGVIYIPFVGWKFVNGSQSFGNYFFGVQKKG